ncbi:MAG: hypothetical protein KBA26_12960 [Candidatus Delongbacteria bacterium]|nr:hypothetical protein [Candidatus Delongbacteria bacterium]
MKKLFLPALTLLLLFASHQAQKRNQELKPATFGYFLTLGTGYLLPSGSIQDLAGNSSFLQLGFQTRLKSKLYGGFDFNIASLPAEFQHDPALGYEQERRWYQISLIGTWYAWTPAKPMNYRYFYAFSPKQGLFLSVKGGYYHHALIFKVLQVKKTFWEESDMNFSRKGFGCAAGLGFLKVFDIGFGIPIGLQLTAYYHLVSTNPGKKIYYYYNGTEFVDRETPYPGSLKENYWQINLSFLIFSLKTPSTGKPSGSKITP